MKKLATLVFSFLLIGITANATSVSSELCEDYTINRYDGKTYIFVEGGVEFSVFADGQFDFAYVGPSYGNGVHVNTPNVNISYNSGHDYEMYIQYDNYGAVIQVENVPIYYDEYGRITQAGEVDIRYNNRRIVRVGGLYVNYNHYGYYAGCTGYINVYNRFYVYRPWHVFYVRPIFVSCIVYDYPYRRYYRPYRYSYYRHRSYYKNRHRVAYTNGRRDFHRPGSRVHYKNGRTARNRDYNPNRRNTMVSEYGRRDNNTTHRGVAKKDKRETSVNKGRPSSSRGIAKKDGRETSVNKGRPASTRGISKKDNRETSVNKGRPVSGRGIAKKGNRETSVNKGRPATSRGIAKRGGGESSVQKGRPASTRGIAKTKRSESSKRTTVNKRSNQSRPKVTSRSGNRNVNKSTNSRSSSSGSRKASSKRGRGL